MPYTTPPLDLFSHQTYILNQELKKDFLNKTDYVLKSKDVGAQLIDFFDMPYFYRIETELNPGVRIAKLYSVIPEIESALAGKKVSLTVPICGKSTIGIDIEKQNPDIIHLKDLLSSQAYHSAVENTNLALCLGKDIDNNPLIANLSAINNLLVSGTLGTGKSSLLHSVILSLLYNNGPDKLKFVICDSAKIEFQVYNGIPHLELPIISDFQNFSFAMSFLITEMEKRQKHLYINGFRNIEDYEKLSDDKSELQPIPRIVVLIDNIESFTKLCERECQSNLLSLVTQGHHLGIHFIISTHRSDAVSVSSNIKSAILPRISFRTVSSLDSRMILGENGAEHLFGCRDMLCKCVTCPETIRVASCNIDDEEIKNVVSYIKNQVSCKHNDEYIKEIEEKFRAFKNASTYYDCDSYETDEIDPMFDNAATIVIERGQASTTMFQKELKVGYARASRIMDQLEENGIIGPSQGANPRQVLISKQEWYKRLCFPDDTSVANNHTQFDDTEQSADAQPQSFKHKESKLVEESSGFSNNEKDDSVNQNFKTPNNSKSKPKERKPFFGLFKKH